MVSKKKSIGPGVEGVESLPGSSAPSPVPFSALNDDELKAEGKKPVFKSKTFQHMSKTSNKKKAWKSLKQIIAQERTQPMPEGCVHYSAIEAPPSFKPAKKYSDILGFLAKYTDPQTKLRYSTSAEFSTIRSLPNDIVTGYLTLRKANIQV
ncbi:INO80 complex subunit C [Neocloeon triangulifer]|uniref:INO80 complex subunit C n=1 Tax=Neocloeon triangulifer TaxID=2078957 RepID=UPI00286F7920|nr:INO80 complex subunit C [Neocloeon triangulifer]